MDERRPQPDTPPLPNKKVCDMKIKRRSGVAGEKAGSKLTKAQELDVEVWDEAALIAFLSEHEK